MDREIELEISSGDAPGVYEVQVVRSVSGGEPTGTAHLPLERLAQRRDGLENSVLASAARARGAPPEAEAPLRRIGETLFTALFHGSVAEAYRASQAVSRDRGQRLRVVLRLTAPELAVLPWEALFDPELRTYVCRKEPLVRHVPAPFTPEPLPVKPPLRVLALVAAPRGLAQLDVEAEQRNLETALSEPIANGRVHLEWLPEASWDAVQSSLLSGQWHVLHFIGHGEYDAETDCGQLALVAPNGRADWVDAPRLADLLSDAEPTPRLVVLNSCASGQGGTADLLSGTAATLVHSGISAVVAMQFRISDRAAIAFPKGFYGALAAGRSVDRAVRSGRLSILGVPQSLEWVTPVLYLRGDASRLFELPPPPPGFDRDTDEPPVPTTVVTAEPGRDPPWWRRPPRLFVVGAAAVGALLVASAVYLLSMRPSDTPLEWTGSSGPTTGQQEVLDRIRVWFADAGDCQGPEVLDPQRGLVDARYADSAVACSYRDETTAVFFTFPTDDMLEDFFEERVERRTEGGELSGGPGRLGPVEPWLVDLPESTPGRAFGLVNDDVRVDPLRSEIGWYRDGSRTFAYVFRTDADFEDLYTWWSDVFGLG